jgi:hypothetical protein
VTMAMLKSAAKGTARVKLPAVTTTKAEGSAPDNKS